MSKCPCEEAYKICNFSGTLANRIYEMRAQEMSGVVVGDVCEYTKNLNEAEKLVSNIEDLLKNIKDYLSGERT